jgi:hypothetical protein
MQTLNEISTKDATSLIFIATFCGESLQSIRKTLQMLSPVECLCEAAKARQTTLKAHGKASSAVSEAKSSVSQGKPILSRVLCESERGRSPQKGQGKVSVGRKDMGSGLSDLSLTHSRSSVVGVCRGIA